LVTAGAEKLQWFIPKTIAPAELQRCFNIIVQFLKNPIDLGDKKAKDMLSKTRRRRIRSPSPSSDTNDTDSDGAEWDAILGVGSTSEERKARKAMRKAKKQQEREARTTARKERKKKEEQEYKSAQFIEDSDAELGDDEAFFARERALRQRMAAASAQGAVAPTMRASGTKKRRKGSEEGGRKIKKRKGTASIAITATAVRDSEDEPAQGTDSDAESDEDAGTRGAAPGDVAEASAPRSRPKPRPRRRQARAASEQPSEVADDALLSDAPGPLSSDAEDDAREIVTEGAAHRRRGRLVLSDDEES
jgi:replication fork protection complex subunit Tof1/Swi1